MLTTSRGLCALSAALAIQTFGCGGSDIPPPQPPDPTPSAATSPDASLTSTATVASPSTASVATDAPTGAPSQSAQAIPYDLPSTSEMAAALAPPEPQLPSSKTSAPITSVLRVQILAHGDIFIDGRKVDSAQLLAAARKAHAKDANLRAIIEADKDATYGTVIRVVDQLKQASIDKIAFAVTTTTP